jgi:hypothetical protein
MAELIVEIHVPLAGAEGAPPTGGDCPIPWVDDVEEHLYDEEEQGALEVYDDGEEADGAYVFCITGDSEQELLAAAARVARLPGVPRGAYAIVTDDEVEELGVGRREELGQAQAI